MNAPAPKGERIGLKACLELMEKRRVALAEATAKLKAANDRRFAELEQSERAARLEPLPLRPGRR